MLKFIGSGVGSGGSVWIIIGYFCGYGFIFVCGGVGNIVSFVIGGSGLGGWIVVYVIIKDEYRGGFYVLGGVLFGF